MNVDEVHAVDVVVQARGRVSPADHVAADAQVAAASTRAPGPVLFAKVQLVLHDDPARAYPAFAKAELDVNGQLIRAHASGPTMRTAIDTMDARLRQQLEHFRDVRDARRRRHRAQTAWHHRDETDTRPPYFPRPEEERDLIRRRTHAVGAQTPAEAAADLDLLGHDFLLFWDTTTDDDAVIHRLDDGSHELIRVSPAIATGDDGITASAVRPRALTEGDAIALLTLGEMPFLVFLDQMSHRGRVLYRRYDGHYGLITPVDDSA